MVDVGALLLLVLSTAANTSYALNSGNATVPINRNAIALNNRNAIALNSGNAIALSSGSPPDQNKVKSLAQGSGRDTIQVAKSEKDRILEDKEAIEKRIKERDAFQRKLDREKARVMGKAEWTVMRYQVVNGDTVYVAELPPIFKFDHIKRSRRQSKDWRRYRRLVYNFKVVYPYALKGREIIREADSVLATNEFSDREREQYLNDYQRKLFKQFEKPLRNMTISQGRLLMKLVDREMGRPSFYIIREYRGRLSAGFWQTIARIFGNDLKKPYDKWGEDRAVEDLVVLYQSGGFDAFYFSLFPTKGRYNPY